jgi:hypothetical protein
MKSLGFHKYLLWENIMTKIKFKMLEEMLETEKLDYINSHLRRKN